MFYIGGQDDGICRGCAHPDIFEGVAERLQDDWRIAGQ